MRSCCRLIGEEAGYLPDQTKARLMHSRFHACTAEDAGSAELCTTVKPAVCGVATIFWAESFLCGIGRIAPSLNHIANISDAFCGMRLLPIRHPVLRFPRNRSIWIPGSLLCDSRSLRVIRRRTGLRNVGCIDPFYQAATVNIAAFIAKRRADDATAALELHASTLSFAAAYKARHASLLSLTGDSPPASATLPVRGRAPRRKARVASNAISARCLVKALLV